jgi:hypothetical protein
MPHERGQDGVEEQDGEAEHDYDSVAGFFFRDLGDPAREGEDGIAGYGPD